MELDDFKKDWQSAIDQKQTPNILTSKVIDQITQNNYQSKIRKIKYPELTGAFICIIAICFIVFNFEKLDTLILQIVGVTAILLLTIITSLSLLSFRQFNSDNLKKPHIEIIKQFAKRKLRFVKYQNINAFLNYMLLVTIIILLPKFFSGKDITLNKPFWLVALPIGYIFLIFFSKWVKRYYGNSLREAEELLKEVEA
ncbi:MAG: hypothetical protein WKF91_03470 [Segetibacter sp.]